MNVSPQVLPLTPDIGAEIHGIDLSTYLDPATFRFIREALLKHLVIFFRDQELTLEQHKDFGRCLANYMFTQLQVLKTIQRFLWSMLMNIRLTSLGKIGTLT